MVETRRNKPKNKANAAAARPPAKAAISTAKRVQPKRRSTTHDAPSPPALKKSNRLLARLNSKENGREKNDTNVSISVEGANYSPPVSSSSSESSVSDGDKNPEDIDEGSADYGTKKPAAKPEKMRGRPKAGILDTADFMAASGGDKTPVIFTHSVGGVTKRFVGLFPQNVAKNSADEYGLACIPCGRFGAVSTISKHLAECECASAPEENTLTTKVMMETTTKDGKLLPGKCKGKGKGSGK